MNAAILLSGGVGTRISSDIPKQYIRINGRMMVSFALRALLSAPQVGLVCVVADPSWQEAIRQELSDDQETVDSLLFADPGANRQLSIWSGLQRILEARSEQSENPEVAADPKDTVFIHDAARPYLTQELIDACYAALSGHDGVLPVLPMKDTVYESTDGRAVARLLDRSRIYAGQAPELFLLDKYVAANAALMPDRILAINGSTEPAIMAGMDIVMIPGDERNRKVTTDPDLEEFREWVRTREDMD